MLQLIVFQRCTVYRGVCCCERSFSFFLFFFYLNILPFYERFQLISRSRVFLFFEWIIEQKVTIALFFIFLVIVKYLPNCSDYFRRVSYFLRRAGFFSVQYSSFRRNEIFLSKIFTLSAISSQCIERSP